MIRKLSRVILLIVLYFISIGLIAWSALAIFYCLPLEGREYVAEAFVLLCLIQLVANKKRFRAVFLSFIFFLVVLGWWLTIRPSFDRDWLTDVSKLPGVKFEGDLVHVTNIRNYNYRSETDFDAMYYDKTFDLKNLKGVDMFISYWGSKAIAHPMLSFYFTDGARIAVSIETRKEKSEEYSSIAGFFKQYELIYIAADERDLVRLRTNYRKEDVYLFHLAPPPQKLKAVFLNYMQRIEKLSKRPEFYNALTQNCTTSMFFSFQVAPPFPPLSLGVLLPGYLDHFLWTVGTERKLLDIPFDEYQKRSYINPAAQKADQDPHFSEAIREGVVKLREGPAPAGP